MDQVLSFCEERIFTPFLYPEAFSSQFAQDSIIRQFVGLSIIVNIGGYLLYFIVAGLSYIFIFDKRLELHPLFLKNQIRREITVSVTSVPLMSTLTVFCFILEVRGYSKLYGGGGDGPLSLGASVLSFVLFTDCLIYWIHRGLHSKWGYKRLHKVHHTWKVPSPFASHAFHPVDGFLQSLPYHIYIFLFPMNKYLYLGMFVVVNIWTVSIHDGDFRVPGLLKNFINGAAHHTDHHLFYNYNYGQFFTLWDKLGSSFKEPSAFLEDSPLQQILRNGRLNCGDNNEAPEIRKKN